MEGVPCPPPVRAVSPPFSCPSSDSGERSVASESYSANSTTEEASPSATASSSGSSRGTPPAKRRRVRAAEEDETQGTPSASSRSPATPPVSRSREDDVWAPANGHGRSASAPEPPAVPVLSAAPKHLSELEERCCVRLGVFRPRTPVTVEQVVDELDAVKMTSRVEQVVREPPRPSGTADDEYEWCRVYFGSPETAALGTALLNYPGRRSKWRRFVTQCPPLPAVPRDWAAGEGPRTAAPRAGETPDTILIRALDGLCVLSTRDLLPGRAVEAFETLKRGGSITVRALCPATDPEGRSSACPQGALCEAVHVRPEALGKLLLRPLPVRTAVPPRSAPGGGPPETLPGDPIDAAPPARSAWEVARQRDTLLVHELPPDVEAAGFHYMFGRCPGFIESYVVLTSVLKRHGVVRFDSPENADLARRQALAHSGLVVTFFGETCDAASPATDAPPPTAASPTPEKDAERLPFPPLPDGWEYGLSRRTMQFFFLQTGKKATTWKHPVTQERYSAKKG